METKLESVLLKDASPELQQQFLELLKQQKDTAELQKSHLCWYFIPSATEYEKMKRFTEAPDYDKCPKCKKGRIVVEIFRDSIGDSSYLVCKWGDKNNKCDFKEYISDDM